MLIMLPYSFKLVIDFIIMAIIGPKLLMGPKIKLPTMVAMKV